MKMRDRKRRHYAPVVRSNKSMKRMWKRIGEKFKAKLTNCMSDAIKRSKVHVKEILERMGPSLHAAACAAALHLTTTEQQQTAPAPL